MLPRSRSFPLRPRNDLPTRRAVRVRIAAGGASRRTAIGRSRRAPPDVRRRGRGGPPGAPSIGQRASLTGGPPSRMRRTRASRAAGEAGGTGSSTEPHRHPRLRPDPASGRRTRPSPRSSRRGLRPNVERGADGGVDEPFRSARRACCRGAGVSRRDDAVPCPRGGATVGGFAAARPRPRPRRANSDATAAGSEPFSRHIHSSPQFHIAVARSDGGARAAQAVRGTQGFLRGRGRGRRRRRRSGSQRHLDFPRRSGLAQRANGPTGRRTRRAARASHPAGPGNAGARTVAAAAAAPQAAGGRTRDKAVLPSSARSCVARGGPCDDPGRIGGARLRISDADGHDRGAGAASAAIPRRASAPATVRGHRTRSAGHTAGRRPMASRRRTPGEPSGKSDDASLAHAGAPRAAPRASDCAGPHAPPHGQGPAPRKPRAKTGPRAIRMGGWRAGEDSNPRPSDS